MAGKKKECSVCGCELSAALADHTDRCKDCDTLRPMERVELSIRSRQAKFLAEIAKELRYIRNRLPVPEGGKDDDEPSKENDES